MKIFLATTSRARIELFRQLGVEFEIVAPTNVAEKTIVFTTPEELVAHNALLKAKSVSRIAGDGLIVGCDTLGFLDGEPLGKPADAEHARQMLLKMNGRVHEMITGVAIVSVQDTRVETGFEKTLVTFNRVSEKQIAEYASSGEPLGKAGAFAVQGIGALLVKKIEGSASNVAGMPLEKLCEMLSAFGVETRFEKVS